MPSQKDVQEINREGKVKSKRTFNQADWSNIAEYVLDEFDTRKAARGNREKHWKEIDRQISMEPLDGAKRLPDGKIDPGKKWMASMELPLQAQALEVMTADQRRFLFSEGENWFKAHAETTDEYLQKVDFQSLILGDELEVPSRINQENVDQLVQSFIHHTLKQYDFYTRWDRVMAESFKYGVGVGRVREQTKNIYIHESAGVRKETQRLPILCPVSIWGLYLDDTRPTMHSATEIGPGHIARDMIKLENLHLAASRGSDDPDDPEGGWMPKHLKGLEPNDDGYVEVLEYEGDLVVPRKTSRSIVIRGAIATVVRAASTAGEQHRAVIRFRFRKQAYSSYLLNPYHYEGCEDTYPTSPLEKGRPVQMMATDALNRLMDSAALKNAPPVGYDRTDTYFASQGGPRIYPHAQWGTTDSLQIYSDVGGEPGALSQVLSMAINLYAELTGVLPARLGAQTVSHTTAYSKEQELQRGAIRTIDFAKSVGHGPLTRFLYMAYDIARKNVRGKQAFYVNSYGGFASVTKDQLPERCQFEWHGQAGPQDERQRAQNKLQSMQMALQMDSLGQQTGQPPVVDLAAAIRALLREGGWSDLDAITKAAVPEGGTAQPAQPPTPAEQGNPGVQAVALQQLGLLGNE